MYWLQQNIFSGSLTYNNQSSLGDMCYIQPTSRAVRCENCISSLTRRFYWKEKGELSL